ncbi:hypothetical protein TALC_00467 [Thermoplasmatales archaeon BRNA1]|nr:hypothetical protein TALC_00467 [Thermoplasmatales archaeon BRNA1]
MGTYQVVAHDGGSGDYDAADSAKTPFQIVKANPTITAPAPVGDLVYNGGSQDLITAGSNTTAGTFTYCATSDGEYTTSLVSAVNAGNTYTAYYTFTPTDTTNYNTVSAQAVAGTLQIAKANPTITAPAPVGDLVYNGGSQDLITAGSNTTAGTFTYCATSDGEYTTSLVSAVNAGNTYTAYYTFTPTDTTNYNTVSAQAVAGTLQIAKANPTITAPVAATPTYSGSAQDLVTAGSSEHGSFTYSTTESGDYDASVPQGTNAGNYTVWYKFTGDANHNDIAATQVASVTIAKANPTITAPVAATPTYSGSAQDLVTAGSSEHGSFTYSTTESGDYDASVPQGTNAGNYTVWYKFTGDANHNDIAATQVASVTIAKATDSWATGPAVSKAWGSDVSATGTLVSGTAPVFRYYTTGERDEEIPNWEWATAGSTVYVKVTTEASDNYLAFTDATISFVVAKGTPAVTAPTAAVGLIYNNSALTLVSAGSTTAGTLQYSLDNSSWDAALPTATNAGSYTVYYRVLGNTNWDDVASDNISASIAKKEVTVAADDKDRPYGDADPELTATVTGKLDDGSTIVYEVSREAGDNVGSYDITPTGEENQGNYHVTYTPGTFIIAVASNTFTTPATVADTTYGVAPVTGGAARFGGDITFQYYSNSECTASVPVITSAPVGNYWAKASTASSGNYSTVVSDPIPFTIATAAAEFTTAPAPADGLVYNGADNDLIGNVPAANAGVIKYAIMLTSDAPADGEAFATAVTGFTWNTEATAVNAGAYTVFYYIDASAEGNYSHLAPAFLNKFTVSIAKATDSWSTVASVADTVYGVAPVTAGAAASGGTVVFTYYSDSARTVAIDNILTQNVGTVYAKATVAESANYNALVNDALSFTIAKADGSVTVAADQVLSYTGVDPVIEYSGNTGAVSFAWFSSAEVSIAAPTDPGSYKVKVTVAESTNYNAYTTDFVAFSIAFGENDYAVDLFFHDSGDASDEVVILGSMLPYTIPALNSGEYDGLVLDHKHMVGFNTAADGSGTAFAFEQVLNAADFAAVAQNHHVTLHMIWAWDQYTVTISGTGAAGVTVTAGQTVIASGSLVDYGTTLTAVIADKTGYVKSVTPAEVVVAANVEFVGTYTPAAYTITFNKNADAATGDMAVLNATYDVDVILTENAFVRTGFVFGGWATAADGAAVYNDKATVKNLIATDGGNVNLYVVWVEVKTEGGTASIDIDTDAVSDQAAQQLVDGAIADANVNTVDISASKTDSVSIKSDAIKAASDANLNVNIETKNGTMEFPSAALKDKVAAGTTVKSEIKEVAIPDAYVNQVPAGTKVFSITLTAGDTAITQFGDVFTVKVKYDPAGATDGLYVAYLANDGTLQKMEGSYYENGYMVFTTNHLSEYAILDEHVDSASSTFVLLMAAIVAICVVLVAVAVSMPLTKKDDE